MGTEKSERESLMVKKREEVSGMKSVEIRRKFVGFMDFICMFECF